jgi:DNA repair ATPase RecN
MSDSTKRGERRDNELKHWERRLKREYFENANSKDVKDFTSFDELKNSKFGEKLKNISNVEEKDRWKDAYTKQEHKRERFVAKREIDNSIMTYDEMKQTSKQQIEELRNKLSKCNDEIFVIENLLKELPERLEGLKDLKKEIESEICWLQYGNS